MNSEDWLIDRVIEQRREVGAGYSPTINRLRHLTDAEAGAMADAAERERHAEKRIDCSCAPRGFVSTPRAVKERMRAEHIAAGVHESFCPMFVGRRDYEPWSFGLTAPSYTLQSGRNAEDAEHVDYVPQRRYGTPE